MGEGPRLVLPAPSFRWGRNRPIPNSPDTAWPVAALDFKRSSKPQTHTQPADSGGGGREAGQCPSPAPDLAVPLSPLRQLQLPGSLESATGHRARMPAAVLVCPIRVLPLGGLGHGGNSCGTGAAPGLTLVAPLPPVAVFEAVVVVMKVALLHALPMVQTPHWASRELPLRPPRQPGLSSETVCYRLHLGCLLLLGPAGPPGGCGGGPGIGSNRRGVVDSHQTGGTRLRLADVTTRGLRRRVRARLRPVCAVLVTAHGNAHWQAPRCLTTRDACTQLAAQLLRPRLLPLALLVILPCVPFMPVPEPRGLYEDVAVSPTSHGARRALAPSRACG